MANPAFSDMDDTAVAAARINERFQPSALELENQRLRAESAERLEVIQQLLRAMPSVLWFESFGKATAVLVLAIRFAQFVSAKSGKREIGNA